MYIYRRCGDIDAHALLLCSLLLGFGLDAYVAHGTILTSSNKKSSTTTAAATMSASLSERNSQVEVEHVWVMTFGATTTSQQGKDVRRVTCWDPITGTSEVFNAFAGRMKLTSMFQLFNHHQLLASMNPSLISLNIEDRNIWHSFKIPREKPSSLEQDTQSSSQVGRVNRGFALYHPNSPSTLAIAKLEENMEAYLRFEVLII